MMSELPIQEYLTLVTPRWGPRKAMVKEKRKRKANLHTPHVEESEAPTSTSFYKGSQTLVKSIEDGRHLRNGHFFSSDPSSFYELSTTTQNQWREVHPSITWCRRKLILVQSVQPAFAPNGPTSRRKFWGQNQIPEILRASKKLPPVKCKDRSEEKAQWLSISRQFSSCQRCHHRWCAPLLQIEDFLQRQKGYKIWSVLDLKDGYHQMPLKEEHRHNTCMSTTKELQWKML